MQEDPIDAPYRVIASDGSRGSIIRPPLLTARTFARLFLQAATWSLSLMIYAGIWWGSTQAVHRVLHIPEHHEAVCPPMHDVGNGWKVSGPCKADPAAPPDTTAVGSYRVVAVY